MEWVRLTKPDEWRASDGGRYLLRRCIAPNGNLGYSLWRVEYVGMYESADAAKESIMTRSGPMSGL